MLAVQKICVNLQAEQNTREDMTSLQMQLNSELFAALQTISVDEGLIKKAVRSLKRIASQKQAKDENLMSMAELEDIVSEGEKDIREGNFQPVAIDNLWK